MLLRDRLKLATTVAFGPRYLHSTGQLHKGGPPNGMFIQITGDDKEDMAIPGAGYGFSTLKAAQALGDLQGAKTQFERALAIDEAAYGPDHPTVATLRNNLATILRDLGTVEDC